MDYKEKLRLAKEALDSGSYDKETIEYIFPELAESDGERIRKEIICFIETEVPQCEARDKYIAWLEKQGEKKSFDDIAKEVTKDKDAAISFLKSTGIMNENGELADEYKIEQGEQKPTDKVEPKFKVGDVVTNKKSRDTVKIVQILHDSYCYSGWDGAATVHSDFSISEQDDWELVKQKPAFEMKTPEESLGIDSDTYSKIVDECVYGEQKSAWSEEDEEMYKKVETAIDSYYAPFSRDAEDMSEWFKNLKDRVQPQPKQEWSKEEQQIIEDAACIILDCVNTAETKEEEERLEELADKLQDLRPQSHWKPTKEQMSAIEGAVNDWGFQRLHLNSLYEQLKKLREE